MTSDHRYLTRRAVTTGLLSTWWTSRTKAASRQRVIVIGAGFAGATCAKYLHVLSPRTEVILVDARSSFMTGPFSNLVLARLRTPDSITRHVSAIARAHGVQALVTRVADVDPVTRRVTTAAGHRLTADRIVVCPGISMRWDSIAGLDADNSNAMPHAWLGDAQVLALRDRLASVTDGAVVLIGAPANPYRCPPGPYERASLIAYLLKATGRTRCKVMVADAKDDFSKSALFKLEWDTLYPGMIEWIPRMSGGEVIRANPASGEVWLRGQSAPIATQAASLIPAQHAGDLAQRAGLTDESGWCPVHPESFESTRYAGVHVLGDACNGAPMPKSGFSANSQAKLCAAAIAAAFSGAPAPAARLLNTCYSLVSNEEAISVSGYYGAVAGKLSALSEGMSPLSGDAQMRQREAREAFAWYDNVTYDSFGRA